jgi:ElaB/YqjD/DUF883 family membrane-anchored ribosome-binding protein
MSMSTDQLERQSEQNRAEVELTLEELRARLTPGQIIDEVLSYAKDGGAHFMSNLGRQVTSNPLPVTLIGAGLAWFLFGNKVDQSRGNGIRRYNQNWDVGSSGEGMYSGNGGSHFSEGGSHFSEKAGETYESAKRGLGGIAHSVGDMAHSVTDTVGGVAHSAGSAISGIGHAASGAYETAAQRAARAASSVKATASSVKATAMDLERKTVDAARNAAGMIMEEPLALIGVGLAIGALVGAIVPNTETENRLMGDAADELKHQATDLASEQFEKAKDTAQHLLNEASATIGANGNANPEQNQNQNFQG